jgi:hypothetical protein
MSLGWLTDPLLSSQVTVNIHIPTAGLPVSLTVGTPTAAPGPSSAVQPRWVRDWARVQLVVHHGAPGYPPRCKRRLAGRPPSGWPAQAG